MKKKIPLILAVIYLILVIVSAIPIFTGGDSLSGVFAVILTQPWASFLGKILPLESGMVSGLLMVGIGALINALIIFLVTKWAVVLFSRR